MCLNIAFVLPYLADRFGGVVAVVKGIGPRLARMGHRVSYWATTAGRNGETGVPLNDAHVYEIGWPRRWYRSQGLAAALSAKIPSVDLVHINGFWPHSTYAASRIAFANHVPYMLQPGGTLEPWSLKSGRLKGLKKSAYLHLVARSTLKRAACLHACSATEAEHFRQAGYHGPAAIIPNAVDLDQLSAGNRAEANECWPELRDRPVVVFMARLSREKGLDVLIPLWAELVRSPAYRDAILAIAGPDYRGYAARVEAMVERYDMSSHVLMTGMVQGPRKAALLRRADVFVLPSYSESFGIVVAEALACGTPVITTTGTPWQPLQSLDAGRWVAPEAAALTGALRELLDMPESQRQAMGQRGRKLVEQHYTWDKVVGRFLTVCDCILRGRTVPFHPEPMEPIPSESQSLLPLAPPAADTVR